MSARQILSESAVNPKVKLLNGAGAPEKRPGRRQDAVTSSLVKILNKIVHFNQYFNNICSLMISRGE